MQLHRVTKNKTKQRGLTAISEGFLFSDRQMDQTKALLQHFPTAVRFVQYLAVEDLSTHPKNSNLNVNITDS